MEITIENIFNTFFIILATCRFTRLIVKDTIFQPVRDMFIVEQEGEYVPKNWFGTLIHCQWCVMIWSTTIILIIGFWGGEAGAFIIGILGISYISSAIYQILEREN